MKKGDRRYRVIQIQRVREKREGEIQEQLDIYRELEKGEVMKVKKGGKEREVINIVVQYFVFIEIFS